jgi:hypothetical protein
VLPIVIASNPELVDPPPPVPETVRVRSLPTVAKEVIPVPVIARSSIPPFPVKSIVVRETAVAAIVKSLLEFPQFQQAQHNLKFVTLQK